MFSKKNLCIWMFALIITSIVSAQNGNSIDHRMGFSIGYQYGFLRDINFSPIHYDQRGVVYRLDYERRNSGKDKLLQVSLDYSQGKMTTPLTDFLETEQVLGNVLLGILKRIGKDTDSKIIWSAGLRYHMDLDYLDYEDQEAFSFLASQSIGPTILAEIVLKDKHKISGQVFIPLVNYVVRPPYNGLNLELDLNPASYLFTQGKFGTLNQLIAYDLQLNYTNKVSERLSLSIDFLNRLQYVNTDDLYRQMQNQLTVGINYNI